MSFSPLSCHSHLETEISLDVDVDNRVLPLHVAPAETIDVLLDEGELLHGFCGRVQCQATHDYTQYTDTQTHQIWRSRTFAGGQYVKSHDLRQTTMSVAGLRESLMLNRDAIFHVLMGSDCRVIGEANARSAARVAAYTKTQTPILMAQQGAHSRAHTQAVFIILLHVDAELRREVVAGTALSVRTRGLCEYKASRLFAGLYDSVINDWIKTGLTTPLDLVDAFRNEYLVS